jgi:hypothetical protein
MSTRLCPIYLKSIRLLSSRIRRGCSSDLFLLNVKIVFFTNLCLACVLNALTVSFHLLWQSWYCLVKIETFYRHLLLPVLYTQVSPHNSVLKNFVTSFCLISLHLPEGAEKNRVKLRQDNRCPGRYSTENLLNESQTPHWLSQYFWYRM